MNGDYICFFVLQILRGHFTYILMAGSVKTVGTYAKFLIKGSGDRIPKGFFRHRLMESRIKNSHLHCICKNFLSYYYPPVICRIVKPGEWKQFFYFFFYVFCNNNGSSKTFPPMYNPVTC